MLEAREGRREVRAPGLHADRDYFVRAHARRGIGQSRLLGELGSGAVGGALRVRVRLRLLAPVSLKCLLIFPRREGTFERASNFGSG
ncbi:Uncharacterized protein DAT39_021728 [Clarias magur]|uniref:Uncharacterized protein n=1 Tax=Clarias magur TaxID=1594786 RepID=A0A8J4WQH8_CLAMG|nr:Uncharacterized protein DAT39_021728 [Clarias magur]